MRLPRQLRTISIRHGAAALACLTVGAFGWLPGAARGQATGASSRPDERAVREPLVLRFGDGEFGEVEPGMGMEKAAWLGISASPAPASLRQQLKLPRGVGLVIDFVAPDSPASAAGLKPFDVLEKLNDQWIINPQQLAVLVRTFKPGDEVKLTVIREGQRQTSTAKLVEKEVRPLEEMRFGDYDRPRPAERGPWGPSDPFGPPGQPGGREQGGPGGPNGHWPAVPPLPPGALRINPVNPGDLPAGATFAFAWDDGTDSLVFRIENGHRHLVAREDKTGKIRFDGPVDTAEQRVGIPGDIRTKLDRLHLRGLEGATTKPSSQPAAPETGAGRGE